MNRPIKVWHLNNHGRSIVDKPLLVGRSELPKKTLWTTKNQMRNSLELRIVSATTIGVTLLLTFLSKTTEGDERVKFSSDKQLAYSTPRRSV